MKSNRQKPSAQERKRVLILDDHPLTRRGLVQLIDNEPDLISCGEAGTAEEALARIRAPLPDLVLADLSLGGKSGLEFIKDMQALHPTIPVLALSMYNETIYAERVLRAGGRGYVMKTEGGEKVLQAIRQVLQGRTFVSDDLSASIIHRFAQGSQSRVDAGLALLTDREFEIFQLLGSGLSSREISRQLHVSIPTVGTHRMHIKEKLKLTTIAQLVQYAVCWVGGQWMG